MNNALGVLGIAKKAGLLEIGDESVNAAVRRKKAKLILSAKDASDASKRRALGYADVGGAAWAQLEFTKSELSRIIGRGAPGMVAVTDPGLAHSFIAKLGKEGTESYENIIEKLQKDAESQMQRRREAATRKRNIRTGKGRTEK